jgi:hypothetical protein
LVAWKGHFYKYTSWLWTLTMLWSIKSKSRVCTMVPKVLWIMQHYTKNEWMSILWGIASSYFWTFVFRNTIYHITLVGQLRPPSNTLFKRMIALETRMHAIPLGIRSNLSVRSLFWKGNQIDFVHVILYCSWNAIICTLRRWDQWLRLFSRSNYPCRLSN